MYPRIIILFVVSYIIIACSSMLPSEEYIGDKTYSSFADIKTRFDLVTIYRTKLPDLISIGFDPFASQNVQILTYTDIIGKFMPNDNIDMDDLPPGVQACIDAKDECFPFTMHFEVMKTDSKGNAAADIFGFVKERETIGWTFGALFILVDDIVVYKIYNGEPHHYEYKKRIRPLGPLQSLGESLIKEVI